MAKPPSMKETMHQSLIEHGFSEEEAVRMTTRCCCNAAQVARLEGENAALAAVLRGLRSLMIDLRNHEGTAVGWKVAIGVWVEAIDAALSDTGEGWLPPEVREQVLKTGRALLAWIGRSPLEPFEGDRVLYSMGLEEDFRAVLDAVELTDMRRNRDAAIKQHRRDVGTAWRWFNIARMVAHDRRLRAETAEALAETRLSIGVFLYHAVKLVTERGVGIQYETPAEAQEEGDDQTGKEKTTLS